MAYCAAPARGNVTKLHVNYNKRYLSHSYRQKHNQSKEMNDFTEKHINSAVVIQRSFRKYWDTRRRADIENNEKPIEDVNNNADVNEGSVAVEEMDSGATYNELRQFYEKLSLNAVRQKYVRNLFDEIEASRTFLKNMETLNACRVEVKGANAASEEVTEESIRRHNQQLRTLEAKRWRKINSS